MKIEYEGPGEIFEAILALCGWVVWIIAVTTFFGLVIYQ